MVLTYLPEKTESVVQILGLQLSAELTDILHGQAGNNAVFAVLKRPELFYLCLLHRLAFSRELLFVDDLEPLEGDDCAFAHEIDVLLVDGGRRVLSDLLKETIDDVKGYKGNHFLDQVVDCADNLFVLAQLALPDQVDN